MATNEEDTSTEPGVDTETQVSDETDTSAESTETRQETQGEGGQQQTERPSRQNRRQARVDVEAANKARDDAQRRFEETNGRYSELERQFAELKGRWDEREKMAPQKDPRADRIVELRKKANDHLHKVTALAGKPELQEAEMQAYYDALDDARDVREEMKRDAQSREAPRQQDPGEMMQRYSIAASLDNDYPDLSTNKRFQMRADEYVYQLATEKRLNPRSPSTIRAAVAMAARDLGINAAGAKLSGGTRGRYGGVAAGEGDGDDTDAPQIHFKGDEAEYRLARSLFPADDESEAYRKWKGVMISEMRGAQH